jgi:hypothetical protein
MVLEQHHRNSSSFEYDVRQRGDASVMVLSPTTSENHKRRRPSFGRPPAIRGLDLFDTPPCALEPLFEHEPLLAGVSNICEPFCGRGNLVLAMREREIRVHAADILDRGCPASQVRDFFETTERPANCRVLLTNPAYSRAMEAIEHALAIEFDVIIVLLKTQFLNAAERFERLHKPGHLQRVHIISERIQDMHDANFTGAKASQPQVHGWFVINRNYCGPAVINPISIKKPTERMPWAR